MIVVIGSQRSGTTALRDILAQNGITDLKEIFHPNDADKWFNLFSFLVRMRLDAVTLLSDPNAILDRYFSEIYDAYGPSVCVDVKYTNFHYFNGIWHMQTSVPVLLAYIKKSRFSIVHCTRENPMRAYISHLIAMRTNVWHTTVQRRGLPPLVVDCNAALRYMETLRSDRRAFSDWLADCDTCIEFPSEAINNPDQASEVLGRLGTLLSKKLIYCRPRLTRTLPRGSLTLANAEEISAFFKGTTFSSAVDAAILFYSGDPGPPSADG